MTDDYVKNLEKRCEELEEKARLGELYWKTIRNDSKEELYSLTQGFYSVADIRRNTELQPLSVGVIPYCCYLHIVPERYSEWSMSDKQKTVGFEKLIGAKFYIENIIFHNRIPKEIMKLMLKKKSNGQL